MVLVSNWRSEEREDAIAGGLRDVTAVAMRSVHHQLERGIDDRARLLGVEGFDEIHRAFDVGEQCGDGLALFFEIFTGWYVGYLNQCAARPLWQRFWRSPKRGAAFAAEVFARFVRGDAAFRTRPHVWAAALRAEPATLPVIASAFPAAHVLASHSPKLRIPTRRLFAAEADWSAVAERELALIEIDGTKNGEGSRSVGIAPGSANEVDSF